jgi:hypothetical protein
VITLLFALGVLTLAGLGMFSWLRPRRPADALEVVGASVLFGSVFVSLGLFALGPIFHGVSLVGVMTALALMAGGHGIWRLRKAPWQSVSGARLFAGLLSVTLLFVAWQAFVQPLSGDGIFNFEVRARLALQYGGSIPREFFSDASRAWMHQSYPLFVSLNELWLYLCLGESHQTLVKALGVLWFAGWACLTFSQLARSTGQPVRGFLVLVSVLLVPTLVFSPGGAVWVWADFPLGAMSVAAALYLVEYQRERTGLGCFAATLAALPWIKREGVIIGIVLIAAFGWTVLRERRWSAFSIAVVPCLLVAAGWKVFVVAMRAPAVSDFTLPTLARLVENLDRLPRVAAIVARELLVWQRWSLLWPIALLAGIRIAREPALARWRPLAVANAALIVIYGSLFVFSAWPNLAWHMLTSFPRLLLPPAMLALVLIAAAVPISSRSREDP